MRKILLIDSDTGATRIMSGLLEKAGYAPIVAASIEAGVKKAAELSTGSVIVAAKSMQGGDVITLINLLRAENYKFPVLAIVDRLGSGQDIREIMRNHYVIDVIQRPAIDKELVDMVNQYSNPLDNHDVIHFHDFLPNASKTWKALEKRIINIASTEENVIIFGECGTGKDQVAKEIFHRSSRADKPMMVLECGAASLVEKITPDDEYHVVYRRIRTYFNKTIGGTLIVKGLENLSSDKQAVLHHILTQEKPDVRLICTANPRLINMAGDGDFKENLYFILRAANLKTPALRDIPGEIKSIAEYFIRQDAEERGLPVKGISPEAVKELKKLDWPGNLRELKNMILLAAWTCEGDKICKKDLDLELYEPQRSPSEKLRCPMEEKRKIIAAIKKYGTKKEASDALGIGRNTLDRLIEKYDIDVNNLNSDVSSDSESGDSHANTPNDTPVDNS